MTHYFTIPNELINIVNYYIDKSNHNINTLKLIAEYNDAVLKQWAGESIAGEEYDTTGYYKLYFKEKFYPVQFRVMGYSNKRLSKISWNDEYEYLEFSLGWDPVPIGFSSTPRARHINNFVKQKFNVCELPPGY